MRAYPSVILPQSVNLQHKVKGTEHGGVLDASVLYHTAQSIGGVCDLLAGNSDRGLGSSEKKEDKRETGRDRDGKDVRKQTQFLSHIAKSAQKVCDLLTGNGHTHLK